MGVRRITDFVVRKKYYASYFFPNYHDPLVYDNSPQDYLSNMSDNHPYLELYRQRDIILCVGQGNWEEELLESTRQMDGLLKAKGIPAWIDYWGFDSAHDWEWWRKQIVYFMEKVVEKRNAILLTSLATLCNPQGSLAM